MIECGGEEAPLEQVEAGLVGGAAVQQGRALQQSDSLHHLSGYAGYEEAFVREEHGQGGQYVDEATYHAAAAAFPQRIRAFIFHQAAPPVGWYDGNGVPRPGFGQWEPCDVLLGVFH